jgi:hypothetical protein
MTLDGLLAKTNAVEADWNLSDDLRESILKDLHGMASREMVPFGRRRAATPAPIVTRS